MNDIMRIIIIILGGSRRWWTARYVVVLCFKIFDLIQLVCNTLVTSNKCPNRLSLLFCTTLAVFVLSITYTSVNDIRQAETILHRLSGTSMYPHFDVGYAQTHHLQHVCSSPLRLQSPKPTLRRGYKGYATLILCRVVSAYVYKFLRISLL